MVSSSEDVREARVPDPPIGSTPFRASPPAHVRVGADALTGTGEGPVNGTVIGPGSDYLFVLPDGTQALFTKLEDGAQLRLKASATWPAPPDFMPAPSWQAPVWAPDPEPKKRMCESCRQVPGAILVEGAIVCGHCALERGPLL